jgi:hypothetical protein
LQKQAADFLRLFLLHPMSRTIDQIGAPPLSTCRGLHSLKGTWILVDTPIALPSNEASGCIDGTTRKHLKLGSVFAANAPIPLQATLKPRSAKFASVHVQFVLSKPLA